MTDKQLPGVMEFARHQIDAVTPDIPDGMTRTEIAQMAIGVGASMCAEVLRVTVALSGPERDGLAFEMDQVAAELGVTW